MTISAALPCRRIITAALAAAAAGTMPAPSAATTDLRGDDARLPDHAALWSRLPLPFSPAQAWHHLSPATQAEIGAAAIGMVLAEYIHGDGMAEADQFLDEGLRSEGADLASDLLNAMTPRLWVLFPDLYARDGDHPV